MRRPARAIVSEQEEKLLAFFLDQLDSSTKEIGLERLCKLYRSGYRLKNPHPFHQRFTGLLRSRFPKVVRWALNAIALAGDSESHLLPTLDAIRTYKNDEDVLGAGVAALICLTNPDNVITLLASIDVPLEGVALLAAAQQTDVFLDHLSKKPVRLDFAEGPELRLATVLVGLDKAPPNLFEPHHDNATIVGVLNSHHDPQVAQYSVWAICENPYLSINDLQIKLPDIESHPPNVRGWIYRLIASSSISVADNQEYISLGSDDGSEEARSGLATGLTNTYFTGLNEIIIDWWSKENADQIKTSLLDHMATNATSCSAYLDIVSDSYRSSPPDSMLRARLEAAASGTSTFSELRRIAVNAEGRSLFGGLSFGKERTTIVNQNISGQNINIGAVSGSETNSAGSIYATQDNAPQIKEQLELLLKFIAESEIEEIYKGKELAEAAHKSPTTENVGNLTKWMKSIVAAGKLGLSAMLIFEKIFQAIEKFAAS